MIGIDYSMSNLTFDERKCIHTVNEDKPNEYRNLLSAVSKAYKLISPTSLFYGFGANSVKHVTEVSDLFVGTGDLLNPIVMTDNLEKEYYSCLKRCELGAPVKFAKVIAKAVEFAEHSVEHFLDEAEGEEKKYEVGHALTYFVVYIFCAGLIDDFGETMAQLAKVINLPISIVMIQLSDKLEDDDIDASQLEEKCEFLFQKANRRFLKVLRIQDLGNLTKGTSQVIDKLTERIPFEIE